MFFHNEFISMQDPYTGGSFSAILQKLSNLSKVFSVHIVKYKQHFGRSVE